MPFRPETPSPRPSVAVLSRSFSAHPVLRRELLARFPSARFNDTGRSLAGRELLDHLAGAERAIVALERIDDAVLAALPELRAIAKYGVGLDNLDLDACARRGVRVGWRGGVNARAVAELTLGLTLAALRHVVRSNREILAGGFRQIMGRELSGRTVGIVGFGHVGREVARLLGPFGCRILAHDIRPLPGVCPETGARRVGLARLLDEAEVVSLHLPLTPATRGMIGPAALARMREDAVLVNTARGGLVDETALREALESGRLSAAAFDVFDPEPPVDRALLELPCFIATGHLGGSSEEAILAMGRAAIEGLLTAADAERHLPVWLRAREAVPA